MIKTVSNILLMSGLILILLAFGPVIRDEVWYKIKELRSQEYVVSTEINESANGSVFSNLLSTRPILMNPVNTEFSLVVEKIGVNVPVVADVSVTDENAYIEALKNGVAHASSSPYPSKSAGNVYIFAHASVNFWKLGKYATVFNLLRKVEINDRIHLYYKGEEYIYKVVNVESIPGWNTYPLTRAVIEPTLTLQTCDPPGTTLSRLVVTANLIETRVL